MLSPLRVRARGVRAFTLIELLVVVAIIALLMSILLPSLDRARAQARQVQCLSNLNSQGKCSNLYAADNGGWIGRGIMGFNAPAPPAGTGEYNIYATTILKYLGYEGDPIKLWRPKGDNMGAAPNPQQQTRLRGALRQFGEQLNCPDFPDDAKTSFESDEERKVGTQLLDYVASAIPIPYTREFIEDDVPGGGQPGDTSEPGSQMSPTGRDQYVDTSRQDDMPFPARFIYVTEAHVSHRWHEMRYHHFFWTSQLPFGAYPRIASDQRHPGGLTALFFDGHARTMQLREMDAGWPNKISLRLIHLTLVPEPY